MLLERKQFILTVGVLSALAIIVFGVFFAPVLYISTDANSSTPNIFNTGLAADAILYLSSLVLWGITPVLLAAAFVRKDRDSNRLHSFYHANIVYFFFANFILTAIEFLILVKWSYSGYDYEPSYKAYFSVQIFQYVLILIVFTAAAYSSNANADFQKDKNVVASRVDSIIGSIETLEAYLNKQAGANDRIATCFDQLKDEMRYLSRFSSQDSLSKLNIAVQDWVSETRNNFAICDSNDLDGKIEKFMIAVGRIKSQIARTK